MSGRVIASMEMPRCLHPCRICLRDPPSWKRYGTIQIAVAWPGYGGLARWPVRSTGTYCANSADYVVEGFGSGRPGECAFRYHHRSYEWSSSSSASTSGPTAWSPASIRRHHAAIAHGGRGPIFQFGIGETPPIQVPTPGVTVQPRLVKRGGVGKIPNSPSLGSDDSISSQNRLVKAQRVPVGPVDQVPAMFFNSTPQQSLQPTPMVGSVGPQARVNVIHNGMGVVGMANPIMTEALRSSCVQKFSGRAEDFGEFEKQWKLHLKLMHGASGGVLPDAAVLLTLKNIWMKHRQRFW